MKKGATNQAKTARIRKNANPRAEKLVMALNAGSSSLKFALFRIKAEPTRLVSAAVDRIGLGETTLSIKNVVSGKTDRTKVSAANHVEALECLVPRLREMAEGAELCGVGHRVVHGGPHYREPRIVDEAMLAELRRLRPFDPEHLPAEIALMELVGRRLPNVPQVGCFDTGFHRDMPRVAKLLPIPRRYNTQDLLRYGFHGLSYAYLMQELERIAGARAAKGRVILAHLGNGASMAAVRNGKSIDTTMAFTPTAGLVMSTRSGDLDPGLVNYLASNEQMSVEQFNHMVNHEAGLLGISETSSDMRDLLAREGEDVRAAEAVALFCYQAKKWIGAYAAALGGLDTLVFAGGIGEHAAPVRTRICDGLEFLGIELDSKRNATNADVISNAASRVAVRVIRTDEELMIARSVCHVLEEKMKERKR